MKGLSERIKLVRHVAGLKQLSVAMPMDMSQQGYSCFENHADHKASTLQKFCNAVGIEIGFLLATEIPVTEETLKMFKSGTLYEHYKQERK